MKRITSIYIIAILLLTLNLFSDQFFTGFAYFNTYSARTLPLGGIQVTTQGRIFRKAKVFVDRNMINASGLFGINFGFSNNLEFGANLTFYQDIGKNAAQANDPDVVDANIPDATYLRIKYRGDGIEFGDSFLGVWSLATSLKYTSKNANIILEPYASEQLQINFTGIFSFYFDQLYMEEGQSAHINLGYIFHNDSPSYNGFSGVADGTAELTYALAYSYPFPYVDLNLELHGNYFITLDSTVQQTKFSTEPFVYITPSVKYKAFAGLSFDIGADILLYTTYDSYTQSVEEGEYHLPYSFNSEIPYYSSWRLLLRTNYYPSTPYVDIPSFSSTTSVRNRVSNSRQVNSRKELFEWLIEEPDRVEYIDMKLEKLRNERKQIEDNIDKLREEMDE